MFRTTCRQDAMAIICNDLVVPRFLLISIICNFPVDFRHAHHCIIDVIWLKRRLLTCKRVYSNRSKI